MTMITTMTMMTMMTNNVGDDDADDNDDDDDDGKDGGWLTGGWLPANELSETHSLPCACGVVATVQCAAQCMQNVWSPHWCRLHREVQCSNTVQYSQYSTWKKLRCCTTELSLERMKTLSGWLVGQC